MTYRDLVRVIIRDVKDLDDEAYICEWTRDVNGVVDPHKTHAPVSHFSMINNEIIIESKDITHGRIRN